MPLWKKIFFTFCGALAAVVVGSWLLPRTAVVERSIEIQRAAPEIFGVLNSFERFNDWSPWFDDDPQAAYTRSGPPAGVGARHAWKGNEAVGEGSQTITASVPDRQVDIALVLGDRPPVLSRYTLEPLATGTRVTWRFEADLGINPVMRWFGLMFDSMIGSDFAQGLGQLKVLLERAPAGAPPPAAAAVPAGN